jgi:hypothetical protein
VRPEESEEVRQVYRSLYEGFKGKELPPEPQKRAAGKSRRKKGKD